MTDHEGHLFVIHGRLEAVVHDAALVPVGARFRPREDWKELVRSEPAKPANWAERGYGRMTAHDAEPLWAISVLVPESHGYRAILDRIGAAISEIAEAMAEEPRVRGEDTLPLVAVPVIGIGRGGFSRERGGVLRELVDLLADVANRERVDIVLVTPDPAVYGAAQYARHRAGAQLGAELEESAQTLALQAQNGELALLMGAGVSAPAGLPTWQRLITDLASHYDVPEIGTDDKLSLIDQAELIERASQRKSKGSFGKRTADFQRRVAERVNEVTRPSLLHALLASLDVREVVTTNYDTLFERAVEATDREIKSVMPWASAQGAKRWVLKLHGDVEHPEMIVLTRRHMVRYDAANRPSAAVLQSLLLTKRLLIIGASMTDDNVIRLAHEVQDYRSHHQKGLQDGFGTVLDVDGDSLRQRLWEGQLEWVMLGKPGGAPGFRTQELFLDRVAALASRDSSSWLLDERFTGLLKTTSDAALAQQARDLYRSLPLSRNDKWDRLRRELQMMGAHSGRRRD